MGRAHRCRRERDRSLSHRLAGPAAGGVQALGAIRRRVGTVADNSGPEENWQRRGPANREGPSPGKGRLRAGRIAENELMQTLMCATCGRSLAEASAWKSSGNRYYCNDFCAEAEASACPEHERRCLHIPPDRRFLAKFVVNQTTWGSPSPLPWTGIDCTELEPSHDDFVQK